MRNICAFIEDGGYDRPEFWLSDGWAYVQARRLDGARSIGNCAARRLGRDAHRDGSRPAGRARRARQLFRGRRLCALGGRAAADRGRMGSRRGRPSRSRATSLESGRLHPEPANARERLCTNLRRCLGMDRRAVTRPIRDIRPADGAVGEYNGKFMCNQFVLRGGSCATPGKSLRARPQLLST